ncbi:rhomboid family intramembrane serine protease [Halorubrum sp. JWXQ-INN 858]|uniref:rhomboid family intramembrane serine protease n=1 Tax=Halorubrum sp. JWXQ-INN 858 TaxID=2690782 RepID=UPI0013592232|nr:rhomboid family intramembrane serine protease [Halorubrum sp. JWXQ-INN 858]MWV64521.1 rhomboid family intramembrane serine protease [Halorubrum sp. JWXQ-INN 858]
MIAEVLLSDAAHLFVAVVAVVVAAVVVRRLDRPDGAWGRRLRSRLLLGLPWGTLLSVAFVVAVYLFVQGGLENPNRPVVIPFRAWSYFYPEGILWSGFAHSSRSHLTGNLLSTLVAGTLAEYAYGHFPRERGSSTFTSASANPYVRAFLFVPGAILLFGAVSSLFALGPVIGFSGVVFALWGFALVHYPIGTIAALTASTLVSVAHATLQRPVELAGATSSYGPPNWANIAVQGHALGLIAGILAAVWLLRWRRATSPGALPSAFVVFGTVLLFGASRRLWAVYWYLGNEQYELYRAIGLALVVLLALIVAVAVAGRDEPVRLPSLRSLRSDGGNRTDRSDDGGRSTESGDAVPSLSPSRSVAPSGSMTPAAIGFVLVVLSLAVVAGPGVLPNLVTVGDEDLPGDPIEIDGYQVTYAEDVEDQMVNVIDVEAFGRSTSVSTSGVIVKNADRHIWTTAVSRGNLAHWEYRAVDVGGTGWRETVWVHRVGWVAAGGDPTYRVDTIHEGDRSTAFVSPAARAEPRLDGRNVTVAAVEGGFELRVEHEGANETAQLPADGDAVVLQGLRLVREDRAVYAERGDSRVRIAERERYEGRERS